MRAVPESFDSMLEELADAAAASVPLPDLAAVRRRARQRTVHRRLTASALAFALLCVTGVAGAAIDGRFHRPEGVTELSAPASSSALGAGPRPGTGTGAPAPSPSASLAAGQAYAGYSGIWSSGTTATNYLIVFPDGVVAVGEKNGFALCYGQAAAVSSAAAAANSAATAATVTGAKSTLPYTDYGCDAADVVQGLVLSTTGSSTTLADTYPTASESIEYTRASGLAETASGVDAAMIKELTGTWTSDDGYKRVLRIEVNGVVTYTTGGSTTSANSGTGQIDAYYGSDARVLTGCTDAMLARLKQEGEAGAIGLKEGCGVLLIQLGPKAGQLSVYTGLGLEAFDRIG